MDHIHDIRVSEQNIILIVMVFTYNAVDALARISHEMSSERNSFDSEYNWDSPIGLKRSDKKARISETGSPQIFLAQGFWALVAVPPYEECESLIFMEWIKIKNTTTNETQTILEERECYATARRTWFWTHPFIPEREHELAIYHSHGGNATTTLFFYQNFTSLPERPPDIQFVDVTGGAGWILVKIQPGVEKLPNLLGYDVAYRRKGDSYWRRTPVDKVIYLESYPYVRPSHYCPLFRKNGTMCLLLSDGIWFDKENEMTVKYELHVTPFRIHNNLLTLGTVVKIQYLHKYCDWEERECYPPIDKDFPDFNITTSTEKDDTTITMTTPTKKRTTTTARATTRGTTTLSPEWWLHNTSQTRPPLKTISDEDLFAIFFGLLLIALSIIPPCAVCLGRRSGQQAAARQWSKLSSKRGSVHIPLGSMA